MDDDAPAQENVTRQTLFRGERGRYLLILLVLGLLVRLVPAYLVYGSNDVGAWRLVIREFNLGRNPYETRKLNWPPLWPALLLYTGRMESVYSLPDYFSVKVIPILCDVAIAVALYIWFLQSGSSPRAAFRRALWYDLNPVAIFTCAFHGQFDSLPALFSLLAVMAITRMKSAAAALSSSFWLSLGILSRTWPIVLLPILLREVRSQGQRIVYVLLALVPTLVSVYILYRQLPDHIMNDVILYRSSGVGWGLSSPGVWMSHAAGRSLAAWLLRLLYLSWLALYVLVWRYRIDAGRAACLAIVTYYVFSPMVGIQHLVWIVGLATLADFKRMRLYTLIASLSILAVYLWSPYNGEHFDFLRRIRTPRFYAAFTGHHAMVISVFVMLPVWLFTIWWYCSLLRDALRTPEEAPAAADLQLNAVV